jgi:hypothetical protein
MLRGVPKHGTSAVLKIGVDIEPNRDNPSHDHDGECGRSYDSDTQFRQLHDVDWQALFRMSQLADASRLARDRQRA